MADSPLKEYVEQSVAQGMRPEEVRAALVSQGWTPADIDQALGVPTRAPKATDGKRKWPIIAAVVVISLAIVGGGVFAYFKFFAASPDRILAKAVNGALAEKSVDYAGSLRVEVTVDPQKKEGAAASQTLAMVGAGEPGQPTKLLLSFDGAYDRLDAAHPKSRGAYTLATTQALGGAPIGTLETRTTGGATYLSLTKVPTVPIFDLSSLAGVWVKFDPAALGGLFGSASATTEAAKIPKPEPTAAQDAAIEKAFSEIRPIYVEETLKDEAVDGTASRHYRLAVDKEKIRAFALKVRDILGDTTSLAYEKFADDFDKFSKDVDVTAFEIWIGKKEGLPTRLRLEAHAKASDTVPGDGTFTLDATFKNFGKAVTIEAPPGAKSIPEIMAQVLGSTGVSQEATISVGSGAPAESKDAKTVSAIRQIQTALELGYSELNGYPIVPHPILLGSANATVLCASKGKPVWAGSEDACDGTVYHGTVGLDPVPDAIGYVYSSTDGHAYTIQFNLDEGAGQLELGMQCADQNGIATKHCVAGDWDGDGLPDGDETADGANPYRPDTDGDGYTDGAEVAGGYDPNGPGKLQAKP